MRGLYAVKPWFVRRLRGAEDEMVARGVSADAVTVAAVVVSIGAGLVIALGGLLDVEALWFLVPPLVVIRLALNALDGSIARRTGTARPFGAALNEAGDRLSDAATIGATAFVVQPALAITAVAAAFAASLFGVVSMALTGSRDSGGPMGKADRAALLAVGAFLAAVAGSTLPFTVVLWIVLLGSVATAGLRIARCHRVLEGSR